MRLPSLFSLAAVLLALAFLLLPGQAAQGYDGCTGFIDSLPATIGTQGVWCLRKDLSTAMASGSAITVATNNVTIDCNEFKVGGLAAGNASVTDGISAINRTAITVRRCSVRGFLRGVVLSGGEGHLVEDNRLDGNLMAGISVTGGNGHVIRGNRVYDTGRTVTGTSSYGISAGASDIIDNVVDGVSSSQSNATLVGIELSGSAGHVVRGNIVRNLAAKTGDQARGIRAQFAPRSRVLGNHVVTAPATAGTGIQGATNTLSLCGGNTVGGFATAYANCQNIGNYTY